MLKQFIQYIESKQLFPPDARLLVAVSGGVDSMVLATLLHQKRYRIGIAHCNFNLRGEAAHDDATFVKNHFEAIGIPVHLANFDTAAYAEKEKTGIQEAARKLRYDFFVHTAQSFDYQYIATAHHLNDNVETMLFNLAHGAGIRGLRGIAQLQNIVRPLLFASKDDIMAYAKIQAIPYREDASNASDKYTRNAIRHHIVPQFEALNPNFLKRAEATLQFFEEQEAIFDFFIKNITKKILSEENNFIKIDIEKLLLYPSTTTILYEILRHKSFASAQCSEITRALQLRHSGKQWYSLTHDLILDRKALIIKEKIENTDTEYFIHQQASVYQIGQNQKLIISSHFELEPNFENKNMAFIDVTKVTFPMTLRRWKAGDFFLPLGMKGKGKKLKDFFTDLKLNRFEKEQIWVLESDEKIVWVVGFRQDERFASSPFSQNNMAIQFIA